MAVTINGTSLKALIPGITEAINKGLRTHIDNTQADISDAAPKDTGRLASSWFVNPDAPGSKQRPETWNPVGIRLGGQARVEVEQYSGQIDAKRTWFIYCTLDYAERVCYDPMYAKNGRGGAVWFRAIETMNERKLKREMDNALQKFR